MLEDNARFEVGFRPRLHAEFSVVIREASDVKCGWRLARPSHTVASVSLLAPELVKLRDGSQIIIRPIEPRNQEKFLAGFEELSPQSRYRRFLSPMVRLNSKWLDYLTVVDHHDHEALIAETPTEDPVGVARYIRSREEPAAAEVAVTVVDPWQGRGAGSALLARLAMRAHAEGITTFRATCLAENRTMLDLLHALGPTRQQTPSHGVVEIEVDLPADIEPGNALHTALRHAAAGALTFRHPLPQPERDEPNEKPRMSSER